MQRPQFFSHIAGINLPETYASKRELCEVEQLDSSQQNNSTYNWGPATKTMP